MRTLVIRGSNALAIRTEYGYRLPTVAEISDHIVVVESFNHGNVKIVASSTGAHPGGDWRWMPIAKLQAALDPETADSIGEALMSKTW